MKSYFTKTPPLLKELYPGYVWDIRSDSDEIYLTFDDGPHPEITLWVLELLKKYQAKATFFCVGENIKKYPETFQQIINSGHAIGNHTFNHLNGWSTRTDRYLENIYKTEQIIGELNSENNKVKSQKLNLPAGEGAEGGKRCSSSAVNQQTTNHKSQTFQADKRAQSSNHITQNSSLKTHHLKLFRPPYGRIRKKQAKSLINNNYRIIMWDVLSGDFDTKMSPEKCYENVIKKTQKGSIIVFHDSEKAFKRLEFTLPKVLEYFNEKRYEFKSVTG